MKKRMLSILLVMVLAFSLLPAAALAADPVNPAQADAADLHMTKNLAMAADGSYTLTLESWATGTEHSEKVIKPMDIVLVLDQSGSMLDEDEKIPVPPEEEELITSLRYNDVRNGSYYVKVGDQYYILHAYRVFLLLGWYYVVYYNDGSTNHYLMNEPAALWTTNPSLPNGQYYPSHGTEYKLEALTTAVNDFISAVHAQRDDNDQPVDHRIAIVGFASDDVYYNNNARWYNTEIFDGEDQTRYDQVTNDTLQAALKRTSDDVELDDLRASVAHLSASGATCSDKGLDLAKQILDARSAADKAERGCAVVMFTDGKPGSGSGASQETYADAAVRVAYGLKQQNKAIVCTVGVFAEDDTEIMYRNYTIRDYMISTSSDYPTAQSVQDVPETKPGTQDEPYESTYYKLAADTADLSRIFEAFVETIVPETTVELNGESVLRDVIKSDDFTAAPGASVSAKAVKMVNGADDTAVTNGLQYSATVPASGVIDVKGFDYSELYHTDGHPGDKLVVTITGLIPKHEGDLESNVNAGVFETADASEAVLAIGTPTLVVDKESYVIDFNAKINLVNNAKLGHVNEDNQNGQFSQNGNAIAYQYTAVDLDGGDANLVMSGVDFAMAFLNGSREWKQINAIPANNIYFDDDLVNHAALTYDDGSGYNAGVTASVSQGATALDDGETGKVYYFTFKGTGIDVYCSTDSESGYVQSAIVTDKADLKGTLVPGTFKAVNCYSAHNFNNVPTVFYDGLNPNTEYTLYLKVLADANFKFDGVRVYNTMGADESVYNDVPAEKNAQFVNLRNNLINDGEDVTFDPNQVDKAYLEGLAGDAKGNLTNVLFVDEPEKIVKQHTVTASNGVPLTDEAGDPIVEDAYQNAYEAYSKIGAKNEVYLDKGQAIIFNIESAVQGDHYWVGLSAPEAGTGKVLLNQVSTDVVSPVDMYYDVVVGEDGNVTIRNDSDSVIAVTNLKVTSEDGSKAVTFGAITPKLLKMASEATAAQTADGTVSDGDVGSTIGNLIRQILSSFVQQLFSSISRMFGK